MRYGICTGFENAELLKKMGFDYIELNVSKLMKMTEEERQAGKEKLQSLSLRAETACVLFPKTVNVLDGSWDEDDMETYLDEAFSMLHGFGTELVVFGSGKARTCPEGLPFDEAYENLVNSVVTAGSIAYRYGITIGIEPLSHAETNMINTIEEAHILRREADQDNVSVIVDFYHLMTNGDALSHIPMLHDFSHMHIAAKAGRRYPVSEEGEQYREFFRELKKIGYNGRMSIEGKTDNIEEDAPKALSLLKKLEQEEM